MSDTTSTADRLREVIGILVAALDDASSVVDAGDDEAYAYQAELELGRSVLAEERRPVLQANARGFYGFPWRVAFHTTEDLEPTSTFDVVSDDTVDVIAADVTREVADLIVLAVNEWHARHKGER